LSEAAISSVTLLDSVGFLAV